MVTKMTKMLTVKEVAEVLQVSYDSALAFVRYSGIDYVKVGRQYRVAGDKLTTFLMKKGHTIVNLNEPSVK